MHACVIMHNMTIESERGGPATRDNHQYDFQGPLANCDHQIPAKFANILAVMK
jgi:hypothetical protein